MLLCSPDWSFTGPKQARRAGCGGEWQGLAREQTSGPVSAAEEVGLQVARRQHTWVGSLALIRCQQWHFLTMSLHKHASQQRWSVLREWRTGLRVDFTTQPAEEVATYGCAHTRAHTPSHKHTHKDLFLAHLLCCFTQMQTPPWRLICCRLGSKEAAEASLGCWLNVTARNSTRADARLGNHLSLWSEGQQAATMPCTSIRGTTSRGLNLNLGPSPRQQSYQRRDSTCGCVVCTFLHYVCSVLWRSYYQGLKSVCAGLFSKSSMI